MGKHILALDVREVSNEGVFCIKDISIYDSILPVSCPELQILPPGFTIPSLLEVTSRFDLVLNACTIGMMSTGCSDSCPKLPDGLWHLRYSVSPSDKVYVEYNYLRITQAMNILNGMLASLNIQLNLPSQELIYQIQELDLIRNFLLAAKIDVEEKNNPEDGINLYRYTRSLMSKMSSKRPYIC